jgi:hypothetical protein
MRKRSKERKKMAEPIKRKKRVEPHPLLRDWHKFASSLKGLQLGTVKQLLEYESERDPRRAHYLRLLLGRYRRLRSPLEEAALYKKGTPPWKVRA